MGQKDPRVMGSYAGRLLIFLGRTCCALFLGPHLLSACIFVCDAELIFLYFRPAPQTKDIASIRARSWFAEFRTGSNEDYYFSTLPIGLTFHRFTSLAQPIFNILSFNSYSAITTS